MTHASQSHSLLRNTSVSMVARVLTMITRIVVVMLLTRYIGKELFGTYNYITALVGSFEVIADFGISQIAIREIAKRREAASTYFGYVLLFKVILAVPFVLLLITAALLDGSNPTIFWGVLLYGASVLLNFFTNSVFVLYRAFEQMSYEALLIILERLLYISLMLLLMAGGADLVTLFWANIVSVLVKLMMGIWLTSWRFVRPQFHMDITVFRQYIRESLPIGIAQLINAFSLRVDIVLLGWLVTDSMVGTFSGAYRIVDALKIAAYVLTTVMIPMLARIRSKHPQQFQATIQRGSKLFIGLALPATVISLITAPQLTLLILGEDFTSTIPVLQILATIILPTYLIQLGFAILVVNNQQGAFTKITALALVVNLALDVLLIPLIGYWGACVGTIVADMLRLILIVLYLQRQEIDLLQTLPKFAVPVVIMGLALWLLTTTLHWLLAIAGASLVYGGVMLMLDTDLRRWFYQQLQGRHYA